MMTAIKTVIERRTGLLFGVYQWPTGPRAFLAIGKSERTNTIFEIGLFGHMIYLARETDAR